MNHLTPEEISAFIDEALPTEASAKVGHHLEECSECRTKLAELRAQDDALFAAKAPLPDDAYFESFAARVQERIGADDPVTSSQEQIDTSQPLEGAPAPRRAGWWNSIFGWVQSPRRVAWAGGVAALVVAAGITFMAVRETRIPQLRDSAANRALGQAVEEQEADEAPRGAGATQGLTDRFDDRATAERQSAAQPGRAREMRRTETGEEVPVDRGAPAFAKEPAAQSPAPTRPGEPVYVQRPQAAQPLSGSALTESTQDVARADAKKELAAATELKSSAEGRRLCGQVRDAANRPLAGAQVVLVDRGTTTTTDAEGRFCVDATAGSHTLTVMAVGFKTLTQTVEVGTSETLALSLDAVDVLAATEKSGAASSLSPQALTRGGAQPAIDEDALGLSADASVALLEAQRLTALAEREGTAKQWDAAARAWSKAAGLMPQGAAKEDGLYRSAETAVRAWEIEPDDERRDRAAKAVRAFLSVASEGPRRDTADEWLKHITAD